jgi:hypothetical protein
MFGVAEPSYIRAVNDQAMDIRFQVQSQFTRSLEHIEVTQEVERHAVPNPNHERLRRCNLPRYCIRQAYIKVKQGPSLEHSAALMERLPSQFSISGYLSPRSHPRLVGSSKMDFLWRKASATVNILALLINLQPC